MKLISWNVNGLRSVLQKGFLDFLRVEDPDFMCLQEIKMMKEQLPEEINFGTYEVIWNPAIRKGYSGTLILSKYKPVSIFYGIDGDYTDEGRVITLEFDSFFLVTVYSPNTKEDLSRLDYRVDFEVALRAYLGRLKKQKHVIVCGDLNVAHQEIDLKNPRANEGHAGFTFEERREFGYLLESGYLDSFRYYYPQTISYSWWSYRFFAREKNIGWRIDYFLTSISLKDYIKDAIIYQDIFGSDHCPVGLLLSMEL